MVLTGKQSLDYSGGVSAEDNFGIGGYDRIMGPNGQAQYWAPDLSSAVDVLLAHYEHTYVAPGERFPRPAPTTDPVDRDISASPHAGPVRLHRARRDLRSGDQPGAQEALRHPLAAARRGRRRPSAAGALGRHARRRVGRGARRAPGRAAGRADRHRVAAAAPARALPGRRPVAVDGRARCSPARRRRPRGRSTRPAGTGRWWCWPTCRGSTARRSRCASCSWSTARRSAARWSTSTARSCSAWSPATTAGRSWCSPGRSTTTWRSPPSRAPTPR